MRKSRLVRLVVVMVVLGLGTSGCRVQGLAFRQDKRVEITSPEAHSTVQLPFTLSWTVRDFELTGEDGSEETDAGYFGVLLNVSPMPPGAGLDYMARDDESCVRAPDCPDEQYLNDRNIYLTTETEFPVDALPDTRPPDRPSAPDKHEITIILLNGRSERIGESAFRVEFFVDRSQR